MANVVEQSEFNDLEIRVRDLESDQESEIDLAIAGAFRELAAAIVCWTNISIADHLNNAAKKLEEKHGC